jgi:hypothetical protein
MFDTFGKFTGPTPDWSTWYNTHYNRLNNSSGWGFSRSLDERQEIMYKLCSELTKQQDTELKNEFNKWLYEQANEFTAAKNAMLVQMKKNGYYESTSELKYFKNKIFFKSKRYPFNFEIIEQARSKYAELVKKKEQELKKNSKVSAAVKYCLEAGQKLEEDFTLETAISCANEIAREKAIEEATAGGVEVEHSSCDECSSWDPQEPRCSCGNRRMYWEDDGDFTNMCVFPAAN